MTAGQIEYFKSWLAYRAGYGSVFFSMDMVIDNGIKNYNVRFLSSGSDDIKYSPIAGGKSWLVQATLEVKFAPTFSSNDLAALELEGVTNINGIRDALVGSETFLHPALVYWGSVFNA
jgi:hypothetical protein